MKIENIIKDYNSNNYDIVIRDTKSNSKWCLVENFDIFEKENVEFKSINKKDRIFLDKFLENNDFQFEVQYAYNNFKNTNLGFEFIHNYNENNIYELIDNPFINKAFKISDEIEKFLTDDLSLFQLSNDDCFDQEEYYSLIYYDYDGVKLNKPYFYECSIEDIEDMGFEILDEKDFIKNKELEF